MKRLILISLAALALSACATEPTRFQPAAGPSRVGFSEMRIEPGRYRVTFQGGPGAPPAQVEDYALLHAADLAVAEGYDWFRVTERTTRETGYSGASLSLGFGGASYGRHSATGVGVAAGGIPLSGGVSLAATLEVLMGKGPKPPNSERDGDVYDARGVQRSLRQRA
ncbi:MAG: CC0125/CC1285 family lipoprotein [Caulobacteraceae bacterium]